MQQPLAANQPLRAPLKIATPPDPDAPAVVGGVKTILVAVSGSGPSEATLALMADLASRLPAEVTAFHVREWLLGLPGEWILGDGGAFDESQQVASRVLDALVRPLVARGIHAEGIAVVGRPGQVASLIVEGARILGADLIVVQLPRRSFLRALFGGKTVRGVQRMSLVPVATVSTPTPARRQASCSAGRARSSGWVAGSNIDRAR